MADKTEEVVTSKEVKYGELVDDGPQTEGGSA